MEEWEEIVGRHRSKYEKMALQDAIKLAYQNEFGAEHLLTDSKAVHDMLVHEYDGIDEEKQEELFEPIGNGLCRMHLNAKGFDERDLFLLERIFLWLAGRKQGSRTAFLRKLKRLGLFRFYGIHKRSEAALELEDYVKAGMPCVHHSSEFRKMYQPHYRVVAQQHTNCYPVLRWIAGQGRKERCVIAIDGGCGSGKTTLAQQIAEVFDCGVVHMDDFFLPQDMRTKRRLSEPGGNVHYERVAEEVLEPLCRGEAVRYRQYDCAAGKMGDKRELPRKAFYIVEGAYALHPHLRPYYTDSIVLHIERALQEERIVTREGNMGAHMFFERWMPLEWRYFEECGVYKHAGAVFESGEDGRIKRFLKQ